MRDIRPAKRIRGLASQPKDEPLAASKKDSSRRRRRRLETSERDIAYSFEEKKRPRFTGSKVPVAPLHIPKSAGKKSKSSPADHPPLFKALPMRKMQIRLGQREQRWVAVLLLLIVLIAGLAAWLFLPKADIALVLRAAPLLVDEELTIRADGAGSEHTIPGTGFFREVTVSGTAPVTSTAIVGTKARGTVQIVNRSLEPQKIKEQSRLVTKDGVLFFMQAPAFVPAATSGAPSRASVQVEAAEAGEGGNISSQRLDFAALDESSRSLLYAETPQGISGGKGESVRVVKEADLEQARQTAAESARGKVEGEIRAELPKDWTALEESWTSEVTRFDTPVESEAQQPEIPFDATVIVRVIGFESTKLEERLKTALESRLEEEFMLFPGPISYTKTVKDVNWNEGVATVNVRVTHTTIPNLSLPTLRQKIAQRSQEEAKTYLEGLPGVRSVSIKLWPFWVQSIPRIEKRIHIDLGTEKQI